MGQINDPFSYWEIMRKRGTQDCLPNLRAQLDLVQLGPDWLPLVIPENWSGNSYLCSPLNQYLGYSREVWRKSGWPGSSSLAWLQRVWSGIDEVVLANNWLLSTNLYPEWQPLESLHRQLLQRYPQRAIVFRSLDRRTNSAWIDNLKALGYRQIFSRLVFYKDVKSSEVWQRRDTQNDLKLARRSSLIWRSAQSWGDGDWQRAAELYRLLYIVKYTPLNPQFTVDYLRHFQAHLGWLRGLFEGQTMVGVIGSLQCRQIMATPILGYDTSQPAKLGLYRLLTLRLAESALRRGYLLHESAGVGRFKRLRGAQAEPEFVLVYHRHLKSRWAWLALEGLVNSLGRYLVERLEA